jgi:hypothetical protein
MRVDPLSSSCASAQCRSPKLCRWLASHRCILRARANKYNGELKQAAPTDRIISAYRRRELYVPLGVLALQNVAVSVIKLDEPVQRSTSKRIRRHGYARDGPPVAFDVEQNTAQIATDERGSD